MAVAAADSIPRSADPLINGLLQGSSWEFGGGPHVVTYSLSLNDTPSGGAWEPSRAHGFLLALEAWSNVANLTFVEMGSGGVFTNSSADIAAVLTGDDLQDVGLLSFGLFPDEEFVDEFFAATAYTRSTYPKPEGDVFFDNYQRELRGVFEGTDGFRYALHEIGHALGLKHPHDDGGNDRPTFASLGISPYDSTDFTVMSYTEIGWSGTGPAIRTHVATPMILDILAIQHIYGANMSYHTGNDTYRLLEYDNTIWDAGGIDTLDASNRSPVKIDLRPGNLSSDKGLGLDDTGIAYGAIIENAIGGRYHDTIIGNDADNVLDGGQGTDTMSGGKGNDTYIVAYSSEPDVINESSDEGIDVVELGDHAGPYALLANIENLLGSGELIGNELDNIITSFPASSSPVTMRGAAGNDTYVFGNPFVVVLEGDSKGDDTVRSSFHSTLPLNVEHLILTGSFNIGGTGNSQNNTITGNQGNNDILGGDGHDTLGGGPDPSLTAPSFGAWRDWASGVTAGDRAVDVNGDHKADLIQFGVNQVSVALSNGSAFGAWAPWTTGVTSRDQVIDLNADGNADLLQLYQGRALAAVSSGTSFESWRDWTSGTTSTDRAVDVNGDGKADLAQFYDSAVLIAQSDGSAFGPWQQWATGITANDQIVDLNGDGNADLLQFYQGRALVALSNGSGFGAWSDWAIGVTSGDRAADVNGDHRADLLQFSGVNVRVAMSTGASFGPWLTGAGGITPSDKTADVDGDNNSDLLQFWNARAIVALATPLPSGDDTLVGGPGIDTFVFNPNFGKDVVTDFEPGADVLQFARSVFGSFVDAGAHTAEDGLGNAVITYDAENSVTLLGVAAASLSANDFLFV